jgi:hypothetical protein
VLITLVLGFSIRHLEFDDDIRHMRSAGNQASLLRDEVMSAFGMRLLPVMVRLDGRDETEVTEAAAETLTSGRGQLPQLQRPPRGKAESERRQWDGEPGDAGTEERLCRVP